MPTRLVFNVQAECDVCGVESSVYRTYHAYPVSSHSICWRTKWREI